MSLPCSKLYKHEYMSDEHLTQNRPGGQELVPSLGMASSVSENHVIHADESRESLHSTDSDFFIPVTTSVSISSEFENNCDIDEVCTQICDQQQPVADSAHDRISENATKIDTFDTLENFGSQGSINTRLIRPLYKYVKNNKCLLCGFESKAKDNFSIRSHLFVHITKKEFKCEICNKKFRTHQFLRNHRTIHNNVFPFSCDVCDKKYRMRSSLRLHKVRKHGERTKFVCDFCDKVLSTNVTLKEHLRIHTGERPFVCAVCKQSFRLKCLLAKHICGPCADDSAEDKSISLDEYLVKHRLIHNDVFKFSCDLCDKKYQTEMCLRNHKRKEHDKKLTNVHLLNTNS